MIDRRAIAPCIAWLCAGCGGPTDGATPDAGADFAEVRDAAAAIDSAAGDGGSFRVAWSISPFTQTLINAGAQFSDGKTVAASKSDLQKLYVAHGANELYVRIATEKTSPPMSASDHSYANALATAATARALSLPLDPELGLWADYGDIGCQPPPDFSGYPEILLPGAWNTLTVDQMVPALRTYGTIMAHALLDSGTQVRIWDLGNEIDLGTAGVAPSGFNCGPNQPWAAPDGVDPAIGMQTVYGLLTMAEPARAAWLTAHVWPHEARLLAAVADGIRAVDPNARFATHISESVDTQFALDFYGAMSAGGMQFDELGFSYYPSSNADPMRASHFRATVEMAHAKFARPIFLAEFAYPAGPIGTGAYQDWLNALPGYPISPAGQSMVLHDLASWGSTAGLSGIRYWAPEVFVSGWGGFAIFAAPNNGPALAGPAIDAIINGLASPDPNAFHD